MPEDKNKKPNGLEKALELASKIFEQEKDASVFSRYGSYPKDIFCDHVDPITKARITWVSSYNLPSGNGWKALGVYDSSSNTVSVDKDYHKKGFVYRHEIGHAKGITDENMADNYALSA